MLPREMSGLEQVRKHAGLGNDLTEILDCKLGGELVAMLDLEHWK